MGVKHSHQTAVANDPDAEVSADRWNQDHIIDGPVDFAVETGNPATPISKLRVYAQKIADRVVPMFKDPDDRMSGFQPALFGNGIILLIPNHGSTAPLSIGAQWSAVTTPTHPTVSGGSLNNRMSRTRLTSAATANSSTGIRTGRPAILREAGFFMYMRVAFATVLSDMQILLGAANDGNALFFNPSSMNSVLGIGKDSGDANFQIMSRAGTGATTKFDIGYAPTAGDVLDVCLYCPPASESVFVRLENKTTETVIVNDAEVTATLPDSTQALNIQLAARTVQAAAVTLDVGHVYVDTEV